MRSERWQEWVAVVVLAFSPVLVGAVASSPTSEPNHRLETETERQQGRLDRLKIFYCRESESDRCRLLGDLEVSLKEVRGELEAVPTDTGSNVDEGVRFARKELGNVRRSLDALDPEIRQAE